MGLTKICVEFDLGLAFKLNEMFDAIVPKHENWLKKAVYNRLTSAWQPQIQWVPDEPCWKYHRHHQRCQSARHVSHGFKKIKRWMWKWAVQWAVDLKLKLVIDILEVRLTLILGNLICTEARTEVPRFVGQKVKQPRHSSRENETLFSMDSIPLIRRSSTSPTFPLFYNTADKPHKGDTKTQTCMEIKRKWSSSLTQIRKVLLRSS